MFFGFNFTFFPQFILGYLGMPRRYHVYTPEFQTWNVMSSTGAVVLAAAYLMPFFYLGWSLLYGQASPASPWNATGPRMANHLAAADAQLREPARR